jgi:hypothetical protein
MARAIGRRVAQNMAILYPVITSPRDHCPTEYGLVAKPKPFDQPNDKEVERGHRQIDREPARTNAGIGIVDSQQTQIGTAGRDDD